MNTAEFKETQGFRLWWAWAAVIALNFLFLYAIIQQVILGIPFGNRPASNIILFLLQFLTLLLLAFLFAIKLTTSVTDEGIRYRFYPFQLKSTLIEWSELSDAYMREYNSFYEYGGWGIRVGSQKNNRAINTTASGREGLQLDFKDGSLLLIGTAKPAELKRVIDLHISAGKIKWGT
ncbi:MAG: hypothetical protein WKI04_17140 [Ferruginibacter sp.]